MIRYIIRDNTRVYLTYEDEQILHQQECIERAQNEIENIAPWIEIDEEQLVKLGESLFDADMAENGDRAWNVMNEFGLDLNEPKGYEW